MDDEADPTRVWVLLMWSGATAPAPNDPKDWPIRGALMGVYATRAAALKELEAECGPEEFARRRWVPTGPDPDCQEFRADDPAEGWFELRQEPIQTRSRFGND
jgi:hypothetical protein